nr:tetratricopeptide repeat protein [Mesorhizobium xinjiangense]
MSVELLKAAALLGLALAAATPAAAAKNHEQPVAADKVSIGSLSGAFLAARVAEVDDDLDSAIAYYKRALAFDPDNPALQQSVMLALVTKGSFDDALPFAEKLKETPEIERFSRLALAVDAFRKGENQDAEILLKLTMESDLDRLITGLMTGWAKLGAGYPQNALAHMRDLDGPQWFDIFRTYHQALIADLAGRDSEALSYYEETLANAAAGAAAPETYMRAARAYAGLLARSGNTDKALEVLDEADSFSAGRPEIVALRRDIETGAQITPLVADVKSGASEVLLDIGSALNRGGGEDFVRIYLQLALALRPDSDAVLVNLAQVAEQQRDSQEAISYYERVPSSSPLKRIADLQMGLNLADLDRHEEAKTHLKKLLSDDPDDMRAYLALGGVYASQEEYGEAAALYDDAVERISQPERGDWNIFYQRGIAYERLKEWPKAEPNFRKALELYPDQPQVMNYLGYSWVDMNMNLDEGLELIRKAVNLRPNDGYIVDSLGWAYYRLGRFEEAARELERAVSLRPDDPILNDHLGDAYWRVGRRREATFQWAHARDMEPEPDLLASVEKKLSRGLPPEEEQRAELVQPIDPAASVSQRSDKPQSPQQAPAAGTLRHTVLPGQSLWSIAAELLGDGNRYIEILNLNPKLRGNPENIAPGQTITLPAPSD